jgi:cytochrome c556
MRLKLEHAQKALEGLAKEDFEAISMHAQKISLLTQDENWQVLQTVEYRRHSDDFRRTSNALAEAARKKNLDAATLAYVQLTMHCMYCHKHVRREQTNK